MGPSRIANTVNKHLAPAIVAVLVIVIGICLITIWLIRRVEPKESIAEYELVTPLAPDPQRPRFEWKACALLGSDPKHPSGLIRGSSQEYEGSDGIWLSYTGLSYASATQAKRELKSKLKNALSVIEREPNLDEKGRKVGERIVAIFPFYNSDKPSVLDETIAAVVRTNRKSISYVESSSMEHVLEFEKKNH